MAMTSDKLPIKPPPDEQRGQLRRGYRYPGRPAHYTDPDEFASRCEEYFRECQEEGRKPVKAGLIRHLGFVSYTAWYTYREKPEFKGTICTWSELCLDEILSEMLLDAENSRILVGIIFYLKCVPRLERDRSGCGQAPGEHQFRPVSKKDDPKMIEGEGDR